MSDSMTKKEMEAEIATLSERVLELKQQLDQSEEENATLLFKLRTEEQEKNKAMTRLGKLEDDGRKRMIQSLETNYAHIQPKTNVVICTTSDPQLLTAKAFATLKYNLELMNPKLDIVILCPGDFKVFQKTREELLEKGLVCLPDNVNTDPEKFLSELRDLLLAKKHKKPSSDWSLGGLW